MPGKRVIGNEQVGDRNTLKSDISIKTRLFMFRLSNDLPFTTQGFGVQVAHRKHLCVCRQTLSAQVFNHS